MIFSVVQRFLPQKPPRPVLPAGIMGQLGNTRRSSTVWWGRYQNSLTKFIRGKLEVIQFKHALYISTADSALTQLMSHHESILQINPLLLNSFTITQQRSVNQRNVVCGSAKLNFPRLPGFTACKIFHHQIWKLHQNGMLRLKVYSECILKMWFDCSVEMWTHHRLRIFSQGEKSRRFLREIFHMHWTT